jgi:two-component system OmpR family response regulator
MSDSKPVLVIDDDPDFLDYVSIVLSSQGYAVETAPNATQGLEMMRRCTPALVIADVMMSYVFDGWTISREMLADADLSDIPIVMVSAIVSLEDDDLFPEAEKSRIDAFMSKPVDPARLLETVAKLTSSTRGG